MPTTLSEKHRGSLQTSNTTSKDARHILNLREKLNIFCISNVKKNVNPKLQVFEFTSRFRKVKDQ